MQFRWPSGFLIIKGGLRRPPPPLVARREKKPGLNWVKQGSEMLNSFGFGFGATYLSKLPSSASPPGLWIFHIQCLFNQPHLRESGFWNQRNFCLGNLEFMKILLIESGILSFGIQNPSSADKDWNPAPGIRNPRHGMRNPRLSWIPSSQTGQLCFVNFIVSFKIIEI